MAKWLKIFALVMLSGSGLSTAWISASGAVTSTTLDVLPDDVAGAPMDRVEVGGIRPLTGQKRAVGTLSTSGNPLWSVPLSVLTVTQERPLFSASRRPPARAVIGPRIEPPPAPVVEKPAERPSLALIGAVVGESDAIAVFLDQANQGILRLRQGETHAGWVLSSILQREVTLTKDDRTEVLVLRRPSVSPGSPEPIGMPIVPAQASGNTGTPYAPFIPRHTPKNGEHDGL
jgi:general secretion pathway protein N